MYATVSKSTLAFEPKYFLIVLVLYVILVLHDNATLLIALTGLILWHIY